MDAKSISKDPNTKGSYLRRAQDVQRTLRQLALGSEPPHMRFLFKYLACEKIAAIIQAMYEGEGSKRLNRPYRLSTGKLVQACGWIGLLIPTADIERLFVDPPADGARLLRNRFVHDMGPTHLSHLQERLHEFEPAMERLLAGIDAIENWIAKNGA